MTPKIEERSYVTPEIELRHANGKVEFIDAKDINVKYFDETI